MQQDPGAAPRAGGLHVLAVISRERVPGAQGVVRLQRLLYVSGGVGVMWPGLGMVTSIICRKCGLFAGCAPAIAVYAAASWAPRLLQQVQLFAERC